MIRAAIATSATRFCGDRAQTTNQSAMTIHPEVIAFW
jgi:hypothetical protein